MSTLRFIRYVTLVTVVISCTADAPDETSDASGDDVFASAAQALTFSNCSAEAAGFCANFGCGCIDGSCNGGFCAGTGCTTDQTNACGFFGCGCADGQCSGAFCPGAACTPRVISDCQAQGQGCYNHACTPAGPTAIGATDGEFSVGQSGDANFSIPIKVVPGTGGVQPSLSFAYNSSAEDTPLGAGWMLNGLSAITRCAANLEQDGFVDPVDFDANDRFCLDGQRLVAVSGPYGGDGTEYRTEVDSQSRIISYGVAPNGGPDRFVVWQKGGLIAGYGHTADSRVQAYFRSAPTQPGPIVTWAINQLNDRLGNYVAYAYEEKEGEHHISRIDYGGAGGLPYADVRFVWEPRPDPSEGFHAGAYTALRSRLRRVLTEFGAAVARRYELFYVQSPAAGRSLLSSLQECGADGSCLPPTRFEAGTQTVGFESSSRTVLPAFSGGVHAHSDGASNEAFADLDGDGDLDRSWIPHGTVDVYASLWNGTSFDPPTLWLTTAGAGYNAYSDQGRYTAWTDLNGDNKADYVWIPFKLSSIVVALSTGTSFATPRIWHSPGSILPWSDGAVLETYADADGDGRSDRVFARNGAIYVLLNTGTSFGPVQEWLPPAVFPRPRNYSAGNKQQDFVDVNGDGRVDFVWVPVDSNDLYVALSNGTRFEQATIWLPNANTSYRPEDSDVYVDMNNDGLPDRVVTPAGTNSSVLVAINTGTSFLPPVAWITGNESSGDPAQRIRSTDARNEHLVDLNEDGRTDRVWLNTLTNTIWVTYAIEQQNAAGQISLRFGTPTELINRSVGGTPYAAVGPSEYAAREIYIDITGDGAVDKVYSPPEGTEFRLIPGRRVAHRLEKITNGVGYERRIEYATLFDPTVYTMDHDAVFPVLDANGAMDVVHIVASSDGLGGFRSKRYAYAGLKMHLQGLVNLGMRQTVEVDETGFNVRQFSQDYKKRLQGMLIADGRVGPGFVALRDTRNTYSSQAVPGSVGTRFVVNLKQSSTTHRDLAAAVVSKSLTENLEIDPFGNVLRLRKTISDDRDAVLSRGEVVTTYTNDTSIWSLGLATRTTLTQTTPATGATVTRTSDQGWDVSKRRLLQEIVEPNVATLRLTRQYGYDSFGNQISMTTSGYDIASRTATAAYDPTGRFAVRAQNALGQTTTASYDPRTGGVLSSTDVNGLITTLEYDGFGRLKRQTVADGTETETEVVACDSTCPSNAVYAMRVTPEGGAPRTTYFDPLGRELRNETIGLEGKRVFVDRRYDVRGRPSQISEPYFAGEAPLWTAMTYDALDRPVRVDNPDATFSTMEYAGLTAVMTNELGQRNTIVRNALDEQVQVRDAAGNLTQFRYDPLGNLIEVRDPLGNVTMTTYDRAGNKTALNDPDRHQSTYTYDALGRVRRQVDAKQQTTELSYDALGRMITRVDNLGGPQQQVTRWTYDSATNGQGALASVKQLRCTAAIATCLTNVETSPEYSETYSYDSLSRPTQTVTRIGGESFVFDASYDSLGRVATMTYPDGGGVRLRLRQAYNTLGYLTQVINDANAQALWTAKTTDARGNITSFDLGNGLSTKRTFDRATGYLTKIETGTAGAPTSIQNLETQFDAIGNLKSRRDVRLNLTDTASYDALNRLSSVTTKLGTAPSTTASATYDVLGNLLSRTGTGNYTYAKTCTGGAPGPHAVTSVTNGSVTTRYCYDQNGNMTVSGARTVDWAPFDKPTRVKNGTLETRFEYGPRQQRYRRTDVSSSGAVITTVYIPGGFERVQSSGKTEYRSVIGDFAVHTRTVGSSATTAIRYVHHDHVDSVNAITDSAGAVKERFSFDAWGRRRNLGGEQLTSSAYTLRGFTNQEQIDGFELVHMNGRVYDPMLGRFISADPFVQSPYDQQSYNRYSYVLNNPLSYTDPSGFLSLKKLGRAIRDFTKASLTIKATFSTKAQLRNLAKLWSDIPGLQSIVQGAACITGFGCLIYYAIELGTGLVSGVSFGEGLKSAAIGFVAGKVANFAVGTALRAVPTQVATGLIRSGVAGTVEDGLAGGLAAEAQGQSFSKGFKEGVKSGALSAAGASVARGLRDATRIPFAVLNADGDDPDRDLSEDEVFEDALARDKPLVAQISALRERLIKIEQKLKDLRAVIRAVEDLEADVGLGAKAILAGFEVGEALAAYTLRRLKRTQGDFEQLRTETQTELTQKIAAREALSSTVIAATVRQLEYLFEGTRPPFSATAGAPAFSATAQAPEFSAVAR